MIVVDSSVWIGQLRNQSTEAVNKLDMIADAASIIVGDLILFEVLQGARDDGHAQRIERNLRRFQFTTMLDDDRTASLAAANYRHLRGLGITVRRSVDVLIATYCIQKGHQLLHQDRDFQPFAEHLGLQLAL
jgi:predicted nucleic acid-binding protein